MVDVFDVICCRRPIRQRQRRVGKDGVTMSTVQELEHRIKEKLARSEEGRRAQQVQMHNNMMEMEARLALYTTVADRLIQEVIRPRVERLAGCFDNAHLPEEEGRHSVVCRFERTARFPATATLELGVTRDGQANNVEVRYSLTILPAFFPYDQHAHLVQPLDVLDEARVAAWVEAKILGFVDVYLRLETLEPYQAENLVSDPVCGMRLNRIHAPAQAEYQGVQYYFCVEECRRKFLANPDRYQAAVPGRSKA
jgi:YHS domain-containing protein